MQPKKVNLREFSKVIIIHNAKAGAQSLFNDMPQRIIDVTNKLRKALGKSVVEEITINRFPEIKKLGKRICEEKVGWVIVAGGDGTLRALVEEFVKADYYPYVSIFPAGTVNLVAKELNQAADADRWIKRVLKGFVTPVWLGQANKRVFLTVAGIGVDSLVVDRVTEKDKKLLSKLAYVKQSGKLVGKELLLHKWQYKFKVMIDKDGKWRNATSVIVAKSRYYAGRFSLVDGGSLSKPTLHVCLFTGGKAIDFLRYTALIAADLLSLDKSVEIIPAQQVQIKCNVDSFAVELDGDSVVKSPLEISLLPNPIYFVS